MEKNKLIEITNSAENKSNKDLVNALSDLKSEFDNTKELIISLTRHMDVISEMYDKVNVELNKRIKK